MNLVGRVKHSCDLSTWHDFMRPRQPPAQDPNEISQAWNKEWAILQPLEQWIGLVSVEMQKMKCWVLQALSVQPARHTWLHSLRVSQKFHKTRFISPLSGIVAVRGRGRMFWPHKPNALFLDHCKENQSKQAEAVSGGGKEKAFGVSQALV